jgi:hypothetical protein
MPQQHVTITICTQEILLATPNVELPLPQMQRARYLNPSLMPQQPVTIAICSHQFFLGSPNVELPSLRQMQRITWYHLPSIILQQPITIARVT